MEDLVNGLKTGKQEAWNMMIDNYSKKVYNLALNFAGNSDDASDITQDIFLKVYNNIQKFQDGSNFTAWLLRLAKNHCIDHWRKNKYNRMKSELDDSIKVEDDLAPIPISPEENLIKSSDAEFLRQKLLLLPPDLRTLIIMRDIQDYSYQEISENLDIPLGTTKSRINRARTKLAKVIMKEGH
jgi:RNA polymerase sigma-70 factor (ECF subfamily)